MSHKIFQMNFAKLYPCYIEKAAKKGRAEVNQIIRWLTGYSEKQLNEIIISEITVEQFFKDAPKMNPNRLLIKGVVCGVRVEEVDDPLMREIRYLDKLIDELAKGKSMDKILRQ